MTYFIADCHFGHKNIIASCNRPFDSLEAMDETLIANWQARVTEKDDVYIVGDLMFFCPDPERYLCRLPGRKHLIIGNHDPVWMKKTSPAFWFESIEHMEVIELAGRSVTLCHYPMMCWTESGRDGLLVYGHIHGNRHDSFWPLLSKMENAFNAGVEVNGYRPVTLEELMENNRPFRRGE